MAKSVDRYYYNSQLAIGDWLWQQQLLLPAYSCSPAITSVSLSESGNGSSGMGWS
jgi:hypothetical protein